MKIIRCLFTIIVFSLLSLSLNAQACESEDSMEQEFTILSQSEFEESVNLMPLRLTRASQFVTNTIWSLYDSSSYFSITFIDRNTSGSGTVTLQKLSGNSWNKVKSMDVSFENASSIEGYIYTSTLTTGTYRHKYELTINSIPETLYSGTKAKN